MWRNKVKIMNSEYCVKIGITERETGIILYRMNDIVGTGISIICMIEPNPFGEKKDFIKNFINPIGKQYKLPSKYNFSSGLDHKKGYKLSYGQVMERK